MATATKTKPEPEVEPQTHVFHSRHGALRLPRVKQVMRVDAIGNQYAHVFFRDEKGRDVARKVYEFERGQLTLTDGQDTYPDGPDGEMQDGVTWLRGHEEYNRKFHEQGREPDRPLPTDDDFLRWVSEASLELDVDRIAELLATERATHNRPLLVKYADDTRKRTLAKLQELQAEPPGEAA